ncbi:MAG: glucose-6-phosphate isomerase [Actinobacteria bacterium]|nr:glucose-6-phosphate isomerase [Actinomycetota bacterium]
MITLHGCDERKSTWDRLNAITSRLAAKDPTLWGEAARDEAAIRLGWVDLPDRSRDLLPILDALSAWSREMGHTNVILCGMGGSSLAPEVIAATYQKSLTVLDSTDPSQIELAADVDLTKSCIIVGSKSGSTIETASQKSYFYQRLTDLGLDPKNHFVIVTDPHSPLDAKSREEGLKVVNADPNVGGRFSALSAYGLTPAALIGVDVSVLLDDAHDAAATFTEVDSVVVRMAALLSEKGYAFTGFYDRGSHVPGIADWIEQLIAESTGKDGKGVLPVVIETPSSELYPVVGFTQEHTLAVLGPLGAQFIFWEWVTALLSYLLNVDPFNQPNVTESKDRTHALLQSWSQEGIVRHKPSLSTEFIEVFASSTLNSLAEYLRALSAPEYIAIMAYVNRISDTALGEIRAVIERKRNRPTTFGWGPRFLHSTGQFHKGGPATGGFIQITTESENALPIPGKDFGFETLLMAQALGDNQALSSRGLPVIRIHLKNRNAGIAELIKAVKEI